MCMWCTATRNLQRPELDWRKAYHFTSERDAHVFTADPISAIEDPPLSFVHSITACGYDGKEHRITFSPENEETIEAMIEAYKSGSSAYARMTIHVHLSMAPIPDPNAKAMSKRGRTTLSTSQALLSPPASLTSQTSQTNHGSMHPSQQSQSHLHSSRGSSHPYSKPLSPTSSSSASSPPPPPPPPLIPSPPITLSTSAMNATFIYPRAVTATTGAKSYMGASSGALSKPSDVWKVFNPALCRNEEMPRLLVLRECVCVEGREARAMRKSSDIKEDEKDNSPAAVLRRGTFDVGSIDYRGHFDYSYSSWFVRPVGGISDRDPVPSSPVQFPPPPLPTATTTAPSHNTNAIHPRRSTPSPPAPTLAVVSSSSASPPLPSPHNNRRHHSNGREKDHLTHQHEAQNHHQAREPRRFRSSSSSGGSTIIEIPPPQAHSRFQQHQLPPPPTAPLPLLASGYTHGAPPPLRLSLSRSPPRSRGRSRGRSRSRSRDDPAPIATERHPGQSRDPGRGYGQRLPSIRQITGEMDEEEAWRGRLHEREYDEMQGVEYQGGRWREPVRPSSSRTDSSRTSPVRLAPAQALGDGTTPKIVTTEPRVLPHPHALGIGRPSGQAAGTPTVPPPHVAPLQPPPPPSAKLLNNFGPRRLLIPSTPTSPSTTTATSSSSSNNAATSSLAPPAHMHPHPMSHSVPSSETPASLPSGSTSNGLGLHTKEMELPPITTIHSHRPRTAGTPLDHSLARSRPTSSHDIDSRGSSRPMSPYGDTRSNRHHQPPPPSSFHFPGMHPNGTSPFSNGDAVGRNGGFERMRRWSTQDHNDDEMMDIKPDVAVLARRSSLDSRTRVRSGAHSSRYLAHPHAMSPPRSVSMSTSPSVTSVTTLPHPYDNASIANAFSIGTTSRPTSGGGERGQSRLFSTLSSTFSPPLSPSSGAHGTTTPTTLKRPRERDFENDPVRTSSSSVPPPRLRPIPAVHSHPHPHLHHTHSSSSTRQADQYYSSSGTSRGMPMSVSPPMSPGDGGSLPPSSISNSRYDVEMTVGKEKNGSLSMPYHHQDERRRRSDPRPSVSLLSPSSPTSISSRQAQVSSRSLPPLQRCTGVSVKQEPAY